MKQKMKEESRKIEESSFTGKVVQITNVSPGATLQQMATLFGFLGTVTDIRLYPSDDDIKVAVKLCYIQYDNSEQCGIAQHLTNTVFIDKALIVVPINRTEVPEENECVSLLKSINAYAGMSTAVLMNHITPSDNEIPPLPPIPVVTTTTDPVEIDEIRRTVFVQNIPPDITADQLMAFFSGVGEVKYLRLCKGDSGKYAFVEFTAIDSVPTALQYNGVLFGGRCLKVDYSKHPIIKPESEQIAIGRSSTRKSRRRSRSRTPRSRSRTRRSRSRSPRRKSLTRSPIRKRSISRSPRRRRSITRSPRRRRSPSRFSNIGLRGLNRESRKDTELVKTIDRRRRSRRSISRSRSPRRKSRSISPRRRSKSRSPIKRSISKSPIRKSKSESPRTKSKSKSPKRSKSRSPRRKSKSKSPKRRSRSRSIRKRTRSKSPKRRSRTRSPRKKSRRRSRTKSPKKKSKKSISKSPERSSVKKKKKDKSKEVEKSTEEELQSLLTKIYTFEEEREKEKKSKEKNRESSDESTKSKKKKKKSSSRE
nr:probable splicing factor, arginine/serine-rich 7 isoform X5 [Hydra vulgaris]